MIVDNAIYVSGRRSEPCSLEHMREVCLWSGAGLPGSDTTSRARRSSIPLVGIQQNNQVQRISAWAAILIVPTIITDVYGMYFEYMPELFCPLGYRFALLLIAVRSGLLYLGFRRSGWL